MPINHGAYGHAAGDIVGNQWCINAMTPLHPALWIFCTSVSNGQGTLALNAPGLCAWPHYVCMDV